MVKFGKKLKGFGKASEILEKEYKKGIEKDTEQENKNNEIILRKEQPLIPEEVLSFIKEKEEKEQKEKKEQEKNKSIDELYLYLKKNNLHKFLVLLFYKILTEKPVNVCEFILNEIDKISKNNTENANDEKNASEEKEIEKEKERETEREREYQGEKKKNDLMDTNDVIKQNLELTNMFTKPDHYEQFLGANHLTLDNLMKILYFFKIENEDKIYFNNLKKIIQIMDTSSNKKNFLKEKLNLSDTVPMDQAAQLVTLFYENYFYNKNSSYHIKRQ